ncbi:MAG TPA: NAD(P)H-dependent oxidoreductase subunit E [Thermoguttaceae bacterium]|nr:NAD(P)H-dependent oxidoreductase subunit E [Thermoguttaceae bacterium]
MPRTDNPSEEYVGDGPTLVEILQEVQRKEGYLPRMTLSRLSRKLDVPLSRLYALATFYRSFSLTPTGRHLISVCLGTACHVRGGQTVSNRLEQLLAVRTGDTTADRRFTLESVRCVGCCSLGPVVRVGNETFARVRQDKLAGILARFQ